MVTNDKVIIFPRLQIGRMSQTSIQQFAPFALVATVVFGFMHVADELAGNWDAGAPGQSLGDPTGASIAVGVILLVSMWALWWILTGRPWGYALAILVGLQFFLTGGMHFLDPANMTTFRWAVVILEVAAAAALIVLAASAFVQRKPWRRGRPAPA